MNEIIKDNLFFEPKKKIVSNKSFQIKDLLDCLKENKLFLQPVIKIFDTLPEPCDSETAKNQMKSRIEKNFKLDVIQKFRVKKEDRSVFFTSNQEIIEKIKMVIIDALVVRKFDKVINERNQYRGLFLEHLVDTFRIEVMNFLSIKNLEKCETHFIEEPKFYVNKNPKKLLVAHKEVENPNVPDFFIYQTSESMIYSESFLLECKSSTKILKNKKKYKQYTYFKRLKEKISQKTNLNSSLGYLTYLNDYNELEVIVDNHNEKVKRCRCKCNLCKFHRSVNLFHTTNFDF